MLLLYTGEAQATESEMEDIRDGLTLLGILQPTPAPHLEKVPKVESDPFYPSLAVGTINSSQVCCTILYYTVLYCTVNLINSLLVTGRAGSVRPQCAGHSVRLQG